LELVSTIECEKPLTDHRVETREAGVDGLATLWPYVENLGYENKLDKDGDVSSIGLKHLALFFISNRLSVGQSLGTSVTAASDIFRIGESTLRRAWDMFLDTTEHFVVSKRGKHAKVLWALDDPALRESCLTFCRAHSGAKNAEKLSPETFRAFLQQEIKTKWEASTAEPAAAPADSKDSNQATITKKQLGLVMAQNRKKKGGSDEDGDGHITREEMELKASEEETKAESVTDNLNNVQSNGKGEHTITWGPGSIAPMGRGSTHAPSVSLSTALRYLRKLGFQKQTYEKGLFFDGHERDDVKEDRKKYLQQKLEQDRFTLHRPPTEAEVKKWMEPNCPEEEKPYVEIVHDESTCSANDSVSWQYIEAGKTGLLRSKSQGAGLMVSAFITEVYGGIMFHDGKIAAETLEYGKGNWWNSVKMIKQLTDVIAIRKKLFPWARACIWRFDHSSNHTAKAADALDATKMNVGPGGKQPKMRSSTVLDLGSPLSDKVLHMVFEVGPQCGQAKGLKQVLLERWPHVNLKTKAAMAERLGQDKDSAAANTDP
jgi:hypothetical protein